MTGFPLGKAAAAMLLVMIISGVAILSAPAIKTSEHYDLVMATFAPEHAAAYRPAIAKFERDNNCRVQLQVVDQKALQDRLQSSLQVGADVPDMVELLYGTLGLFTSGPLADVKLTDLTPRIAQDNLMDRVVANRFPRWSSRGRIYGLPHDVHPVMLAYRRDLCDQLGIDPTQLTTWEKFAEVGRQLKGRHQAGDAVAQRYMLDLAYDGGDTLKLLLIQHGGGLFDEHGNVSFDSSVAADTVSWYIRQTRGDHPIGYGCGSGQGFSKALLDGLCLFYFCPDWRTKQFITDVPSLAGKMALMPMPAWEEGGIRTSTWGGTGLAITKQCRRPDLAWKLAMYLYYDAAQVGPRFAATDILPPLKTAWTDPAIRAENAFYSGQRLGQEFVNVASQVPKDYDTAYSTQATTKLSEAFTNAATYYEQHGEDGLREFTAGELKRCADQVRRLMARNVFLNDGEQQGVAQ